MLRPWLEYLFFSTRGEQLARLEWRRYLPAAVIAAWLAGLGRYWDHPSAHWLQRLGLGSTVYVFALSALLWLVVLPLRPVRWGTFVALTSPPSVLYAIPVESWVPLEVAVRINV